jgi:hypothetical protein
MLFCRATPERDQFHLGIFLWRNRRHGRLLTGLFGKILVDGIGERVLLPVRRFAEAHCPRPALDVLWRLKRGIGWRWRAWRDRGNG